MSEVLEKMQGINEVVAEVVKYLNSKLNEKKIYCYESFEYVPTKPLVEKTNVYIGINDIEISSMSGVGGSLGEYRAMNLTLKLDMFSQKELGGGSVRKAFGDVAEAFLQSDFSFENISAQEIKYNEKIHALCLGAKVTMKMLVKASEMSKTDFTGFEIKGEYTL